MVDRACTMELQGHHRLSLNLMAHKDPYAAGLLSRWVVNTSPCWDVHPGGTELLCLGPFWTLSVGPSQYPL